MDIYWQHVSGNKISPKYDSPDSLIQFSDKYFEDYCMCHKNDAMMLRTVGIRSCEPDYRLLNKYQDRHAILWIISGEGWCNGIPISEGNVVYFKTKIPYNFSSNPANPCVYAWITFKGDAVNSYLKHMGLVGKFHIFKTPNFKEVYKILYDIIYIPCTNSDIDLYLEASFLRLLSLTVPDTTLDEAEHIHVVNTRVNAALKYISEHYRDSGFRVHNVSDAIGISEKYFRKIFKEELGISVLEYTIKLRMDAAANLLLNSNYNISEISEMVGYTDYRQFYDIFKTRFGCSPNQYRNSVLKS